MRHEAAACASLSESFSEPYVVSACSSAAMLTKPEGQSRSKTLKAPLTCAGVYDVLTLRDITVTNSAAVERGHRRWFTQGSAAGSV